MRNRIQPTNICIALFVLLLCIQNKGLSQATTLSFATNSLPTTLPGILPNKIAMKNLPCGIYAVHICSDVDYSKFNLVYKLKIVDPNPAVNIYTAGKNGFNVSCTIASKFVHCSTAVTTANIDMSPTTGTQTSALMTLSGTASSASTEAILSIPFEVAGMNASCFAAFMSSYIQTTITGLSITGVNNNFVKLEAYIEEVNGKQNYIGPMYQTKPVQVVGNNKINFSWTSCAPITQLQVLKLYNKNNAKLTEIDIDVDPEEYSYNNNKRGWFEALTINVAGTGTNVNKSLTLVDGTGFYVWRVRGLNNTFPGGEANPNNWGPWSTMYPNFTGASLVNITQSNTALEPSIFYFDQFDDTKNWIYTRSFVEGNSTLNNDLKETLIGESIKYANGLGMVKQSQSFNNQDNEVLVNETMQDYVGRDALQTSTASVAQQYLGHIDNLNQGYNEANFDADLTYKNPNGLPINSIIAQYYSNSNTDLGVPNADSFAYTRTRFNRSPLNEVRESSLAGKELTIRTSGVSHTNRLLTGDVADIELVRVFGEEAPNPNNVMKNITIDANNEIHVSYVDKAGKVIATCLSLEPGQNLEPLASALDPNNIFDVDYHLIGGTQGANANEIVETKIIALAKTTTLNFEYKLEEKKIKFLCETMCKTCDYEVSFTVQNEEELDLPPVWENSVTINPTIIDCDNANGALLVVPFNNPTYTIAPALPQGTYIITKTVKFHNKNAASIPYLSEYINDVNQAIDDEIYSGAADWEVCDVNGIPVPGLALINIGDLNNKLSNQLMVGINGVYAMLGINPISSTPVVRKIKKDPFITDGKPMCDAVFSFTITPCIEIVCPDPDVFANDLVTQFSNAILDYNNANPSCTALSTNNADHFVIHNEIYVYDNGSNYQMSNVEMETVIKNMIIDYNTQVGPNDIGKNYSCENIKNAWESAIEDYLAHALSICQNPTATTVVVENDFLDKFFMLLGYRFVGATADPTPVGPGLGFVSHPYKCFYYPANVQAGTSSLSTMIPANPSTALASSIMNGNSLYNATKDIACNALTPAGSAADHTNYFDPNFGNSALPVTTFSSCQKSEGCLFNFFKSIQYPLNASLFAAFGVPPGATYDNIVSLTQQNERLCKRICQANHDMYEAEIVSEFATPKLNAAAIGLVEDNNLLSPLGYNSNISTLPARDNASINWVETYTQMAVEHCKSKCHLTIQSTGCPGAGCTVTGIGTPEEQVEFIKASTMGAKIYLTTSFENLGGTPNVPDREYWMSLYENPCEVCFDLKGMPYNSSNCDETQVEGNTTTLNPLPNIDGFKYTSCCPTLEPGSDYSEFPMEHIDYDREISLSNLLAFSPDRVTGVAYDLAPWLTRKILNKASQGPIPSTFNIYDIVYNYVNPVSDDLSGSNGVTHTFPADDYTSPTINKQLESDPTAAGVGHTKNITVNQYPAEVMVGMKTIATNTVTVSGYPITIKRTHSSQLAMHGYMKVKIEVTPPIGFTGDITFKDELSDYTTSGAKVLFIDDYPKKDNTTSNEIVKNKSFTPLNNTPLVLEYLIRIKKNNFSPFGTNDINNFDIYSIRNNPLLLTGQAEYPVDYSRSSIDINNSGSYTGIAPYNQVNIPILRVYDKGIKPNLQAAASFNAPINPEDDIQNAYIVTNTGVIPAGAPPTMSVNTYVQVVALSYNYSIVKTNPHSGLPILDANGNPIFNNVTQTLWPYFNNHKVFQPASICIQYVPFDVPQDMDQLLPTSCNEALSMNLLSSLSTQVDNIKKAKVQELKNKYIATCGAAGLNDDFKVWYQEGLHHYTLYYYNRAGNLIRTVAPEGVGSVPKAASRTTWQDYKQATVYDYNSLNQITKSRTPDGGETQFIYDNKGRLRFSQNAKQKVVLLGNQRCSYVLYDALGRTIESGEFQYTSAPFLGTMQPFANTPSYPSTNTNDVVKTTYTTPYPLNYIVGGGAPQNTLNRVAYTISMKNPTAATALLRGEVVNVFSYDLNGNAVWTAQKILDMPFTFMRYEFDYVSGAVLKTVYNERLVDAFHHRNKYDANKKLLSTETSRNGVQWDKDATYTYYKHGPLKNVLLGQDKIQSIDYAYTINGWLKAMNHPSLDANKNYNYNAAIDISDAFATKLQYFPDDFKRTGSPYNFTETGVNPYNYVPAMPHDLYNGNISAILTSNVSSLQTVALDNPVKFHVNDYKYDELNRLRTVNYGVKNASNAYALVSNDSYKEDFMYDANGNIKTAYRYDYKPTGVASIIDNFTYTYTNSPVANNSYTANNRLNSLTEAGVNVAGYTDIKAGTAKNYSYDAIGNLTADSDEGLAVDWNVAGKVDRISKTVGVNTTTTIYYYDAMGNRVAKSVAVGAALPTWEYYSRDASGNIMANYNRTAGIGATGITVFANDQPIYGSSRLGVLNSGVKYYSGTVNALPPTYLQVPVINSYINYRTVGLKKYELADHLQNTRNIFTDIRNSVKTGTANPNISFGAFSLDARAVYNYYAYGMPKTSLNDYKEAASNEYKFGFNGQLKENALAGIGNHNTALFWEYDTRLGRRWNLDPMDQVSISNYAVFENNPVINTDENGDTPLFGAVLGAALDIGFQLIAIHYLETQTSINWGSVIVSGIAGASGVGLATVIEKGVGSLAVGTITKLVVKTAVDVAADAGLGVVEDVTKDILEDGSMDKPIDLKGNLLSSLVGNAAGQIADKVKTDKVLKSPEAKVLDEKAKRLERNAKNNPKPTRTKKAEDARKQHTDHVKGKSVRAGLNASGIVKSSIKVKNEKDKKNDKKSNKPLATASPKPCFVKGTLVSTIKGLIPIENIKKGDSVLSYNFILKSNEHQEVVELHESISDTIVDLEFPGDVRIQTTPIHSFFVNDGSWIPAGNLKVSDLVWLADGKKLRLVKINKRKEKEIVYNFEVNLNHNYYVSSLEILVHNSENRKCK